MDKNNKELSLLEASNKMYENSKKETIEMLRLATNDDGSRKYSDNDINETIRLLEEMQKDVQEQYVNAGGDLNHIKNAQLNHNSNNEETIFDEISKLNNNSVNNDKKINVENNYTSAINVEHDSFSKALYDVIPLPSKGECYKHKIGKIPVSYLTAYDENLIISPNLYNDGTFIDYLLKEKIMNYNIDPSELTNGDRDAIILWLRASGYGNEFPVSARDNETGEMFDTVVDLSKIKFKPFNLKGDENGYFDFTLPISKDKIKFKFLTNKDEKNLELIDINEYNKVKKDKLNEIIDVINNLSENDNSIDKKTKIKINESVKTLEKWADSISDEESIKFTHAVTNKLELSIISVNDITDRKYIKNYVRNMKVKDSSALRKYITENEPGLDFNIEVNKPESLGGGSMTMFLSLDQYIFLNIA